MSSLFGSMVRGFGFTIGRRAADSMLNSTTPINGGLFGLNTKQQWVSILIWFTSLCVIGNTWGMEMGILWTIFGLIPSVLIVQIYVKYQKNKRTKEINKLENTIKEKLIIKINALIQESKSFPSIDVSIKNIDDIQYATLESLEYTHDTISNLLIKTKYLSSKYNNEIVEKILNDELWLGMNEEQMLDMKGNSTTIEKETLKNGALRTTYIYGTKRSGDVLVFEDDKLVSFKDR